MMQTDRPEPSDQSSIEQIRSKISRHFGPVDDGEDERRRGNELTGFEPSAEQVHLHRRSADVCDRGRDSCGDAGKDPVPRLISSGTDRNLGSRMR